MLLAPQEESTLFTLLADVGWRWRDDTLFAPYESIWLSRPAWTEDLQDFHKRMVRRVERIENNREGHQNVSTYYRTLFDTQSLAWTLRALMEMHWE